MSKQRRKRMSHRFGATTDAVAVVHVELQVQVQVPGRDPKPQRMLQSSCAVAP